MNDLLYSLAGQGCIWFDSAISIIDDTCALFDSDFTEISTLSSGLKGRAGVSAKAEELLQAAELTADRLRSSTTSTKEEMHHLVSRARREFDTALER